MLDGAASQPVFYAAVFCFANDALSHALTTRVNEYKRVPFAYGGASCLWDYDSTTSYRCQ